MKRLKQTIHKAVILAVGVTALTMVTIVSCGKENNKKSVDGYVPLDLDEPIIFGGDYIVYDEETIKLGEKSIYVDATLSDEVADRYEYVYNDFKEAVAALSDGTEAEPMKVYIAPYVYWIDDPDDEAIREAVTGDIPYGLVIKCENLHLIGLTKDPYNVVLAVNRGQTQGAKGNYTMFYFDGNGIRTENLTMGNYCNVDLEYPLKPELSRQKRAEAITQAQLALTNGDKIVATNCNFISRLNACPFTGSGGRILFKDCHIECGDDALPGTALFLDCTVGFYSSKPFYNTSGTGAVFMNCEISSEVKGTQYLTKAGGTVTLIDCNFVSSHSDFKVEWTPEPGAGLRCIQSNVTLNGKNIVIAEADKKNTIDLTGAEAAKAFVIKAGDKTIYNTYNLLQGKDGWDPLNNRPEVEAVAEKYVLYPYMMTVTPAISSVKNGASGNLKAGYRYFRNINGEAFSDTVTWTVDDTLKDYVSIEQNEDGSCNYKIIKSSDSNVSGMIYAKSSLGFFGGAYITITPDITGAPTFTQMPTVAIGASTGKGCVIVDYALNSDLQDISVIDWYRVSADGKESVKVATSRLDEPEYVYELTEGDIGYYIMAEVTPKVRNSESGSKVSVKTSGTISADDKVQKNISTDFKNFVTEYRPDVREGFWTVSGFKPLDTADYDWKAKTEAGWIYGEGEGGAKDTTGLKQTVRGSRILYTPVAGSYGDMTVTLAVNPCKSAGQGFGSATGQYMDICIKMDNGTMNGYALRIERTSKYSNAVDFKLVKYTDGMAEAISEPVSASCYNTTCTIVVSVKGTTLTAHAETSKKQNEEQAAAGLAHVVDLTADIAKNTFGGVGVVHTGTAGANSTLLTQMDIVWE